MQIVVKSSCLTIKTVVLKKKKETKKLCSEWGFYAVLCVARDHFIFHSLGKLKWNP